MPCGLTLLTMDQTQVMEYTRQAIMLTLKLGMPCMLVGLFVGVAVGLVQALTQIQEMTLTFVPKIIVMFLTLFLLLPWMTTELIEFTRFLADQMIGGGVPPAS